MSPEERYRAMLDLRRAGMTLKMIAAQFRLTPQAVSKILLSAPPICPQKPSSLKAGGLYEGGNKRSLLRLVVAVGGEADRLWENTYAGRRPGRCVAFIEEADPAAVRCITETAFLAWQRRLITSSLTGDCYERALRGLSMTLPKVPNRGTIARWAPGARERQRLWQQQARRVKELRGKGHSWREVAEILDIPFRPARFARMIKSPDYDPTLKIRGKD